MNKKKRLRYILGILPILAVLLLYSQLPDMVPMQWNSGGVSRYDEKWSLLIVSALSLFLGVGMPFMAKIDPRKKNYNKFYDVYENIILLIQLFMGVLIVFTLIESLNPGTLPIPQMVMLAVGLLFICLGNMMPKVKSNFFTGFKTPWALSSETVWNKTQRLGGKLFVAMGLIMMLGSFFVPENYMTAIMIGMVVVVCIVPMLMSYIWYQREIGLENSGDQK